MTLNTPDTAKITPKSNGYENYHIGISGQMEYLYGKDVETRPGFAIEALLAHISFIAENYAKKRHLSHEDIGTARILALAKKDPLVRAELRHCQGLIERAHGNLAKILGVSPGKTHVPAEPELSE